MCRAYNDWAMAYCQDSGGRVKFVGKVTMLDVEESIREIERLAARPEAAAIVLPPPLSDGTPRSDPRFDPVWSALCAVDFPACFHGGNSQLTWFRPMVEKGLWTTVHALAFPMDAMLAIGMVIEGGVLERFPELRTAFYEANAWSRPGFDRPPRG